MKKANLINQNLSKELFLLFSIFVDDGRPFFQQNMATADFSFGIDDNTGVIDSSVRMI
jgi:hypothetical protein